MRMTKFNRVIAECPKLARFEYTFRSVLDSVPDALQDSLTGRQLGQVLALLNDAYCRGLASAGAQASGGAVWIDDLGHMYDLDEIKEKCTPGGRRN